MNTKIDFDESQIIQFIFTVNRKGFFLHLHYKKVNLVVLFNIVILVRIHIISSAHQ